MQDRFKFRAWDENNKIMHYDYQAIKSLSKNGWLIFQSDQQKLDWDNEKKFCVNVYPNQYFAEQLKIMQCTGLKDKNDKLIYEGDIIFNSCLGLHNQISWDDEAAAFMFKEIRNRKGFGCTGSMYAILQQYSKYCEIIGNIHENPELLEAEMTNYEKLCEILEIEKHISFKTIPNTPITGLSTVIKMESFYFPFTEEKQYALLKLISKEHKIEIFFMKNGSEEYGILCYNQLSYNKDLSEALSEVALNLIKIDKLNKDEVRRILE